MADRVEQQLLGYLLDALDESEQEQIREQLAVDPALRQQLGQLRKSLRPLESSLVTFSPPAGLAERTCRFVAEYDSSAAEVIEGATYEEVVSPALSSDPLAEADAPVGVTGGWSWRDLAVAAAIVAAASLLLFPAIENSRFNTQVHACRDNLRLLGHALGQYSQQHRDYFPPVPQEGPLASAGAFAPVLAGMGYLESPRWVVCPASSLAAEPDFKIPSLEEVAAANDELRRRRLLGRLGGSYGYSLGFVEDGHYHSPRNLRRASFALMSDAPSNRLSGYQSVNHRGRGQNVLFEDFHVEFLTTPQPDNLSDNFFTNDRGEVAPGQHRNDSVITGSGELPARTR